jgi:metallophosphoesterase (TIGR00282 family)
LTRILAIGDIMGKAGRRALEGLLPRARAEFAPDLVLVNGENAAGGFGLTEKIYQQFVSPSPAGLGIDAVTMGNHWHDKREIYQFMGRADRMVVPGNMANVDRDEDGLKVIVGHGGTRFAVVNLIGRPFMHGENRCPFKTADKLLERVPPSIKIRIVDLHAEATSEKQALAWHLAGRVSLFYGTHTHVPSADERILTGGTGYTTDLGMTGPYDSVIGIRKEASIARFLTGEKRKWEPATEDPWLTALVADVDESTGKCRAVQRIRWALGAGAGASDDAGSGGDD